MESERLAKTIIISSFTTILIIGSLAYLFREVFIKYVETRLETRQYQEIDLLISHNEQVIKTIERVNPAVVSVVVTKDVPVYEKYYESINSGGIFGGFSIPRVREKGTEERVVGGGSGFIVSNDGMIVTNKHVVEDSEAQYSVLLNDGTAYDVEILARDPQFDIAIMKISDPLENALTFVSFGDSESLQLGETVIAIGNALAEFRNSISVGVVSGLSRSIVASDNQGRSEQLDHVIQTDAAINPGNSGGPLLNIRGEVVGVNVATSRDADNIGFALPAGVVKSVVESVREYGEIVRPFLGVRYVMLNERMAKENNFEVSYGALVIPSEIEGDFAVMPDSPAAKVGITEGTIILSIDGEELRNLDLATVLRRKEVGQKLKLNILQDGEEKVVFATLDKTL